MGERERRAALVKKANRKEETDKSAGAADGVAFQPLAPYISHQQAKQERERHELLHIRDVRGGPEQDQSSDKRKEPKVKERDEETNPLLLVTFFGPI